jgi:hypothetical protein
MPHHHDVVGDRAKAHGSGGCNIPGCCGGDWEVCFSKEDGIVQEQAAALVGGVLGVTEWVFSLCSVRCLVLSGAMERRRWNEG